MVTKLQKDKRIDPVTKLFLRTKLQYMKVLFVHVFVENGNGK